MESELFNVAAAQFFKLTLRQSRPDPPATSQFGAKPLEAQFNFRELERVSRQRDPLILRAEAEADLAALLDMDQINRDPPLDVPNS